MDNKNMYYANDSVNILHIHIDVIFRIGYLYFMIKAHINHEYFCSK